ncbi:MAG: SMI1/KNR4 family protein [Timaviella obliquedivisa GSE-PSE-MK23-08B]|jgi:hypothetical protein|nr:SMI1/KNR4 family protein [Timaviella obliquedivisa GSE-PSE-MK23-08B]
MNYATYIKNFKNRKIPEAMERLLQLSNNLDNLSEDLCYAGIYFSFVEDSDEYLTLLLGYESQLVESILGIATNGAGDLLAFWVYDDRDLEDAPIVFVGHEGDACVMANNFSELLPLLVSSGDLHPDNIPEHLNEFNEFDGDSILGKITLKMEEDGFYSPGTLQELIERREETKIEQADFATRLGIQLPENPAELMRTAIEAHPNFEEWLNHQISIENPDYFN